MGHDAADTLLFNMNIKQALPPQRSIFRLVSARRVDKVRGFYTRIRPSANKSRRRIASVASMNPSNKGVLDYSYESTVIAVSKCHTKH